MLTLERYASAILAHDHFGDAETETHFFAWEISVRLLYRFEDLEDILLLFELDADASVFHSKLKLPFGLVKNTSYSDSTIVSIGNGIWN